MQIGRERRRIRADDSKIVVTDLSQHRVDAVDAGSGDHAEEETAHADRYGRGSRQSDGAVGA
jgi:hypothetical protein